MIERYHLDLAVVALAFGVVVTLVAVRVPALSRRVVAISAAAGAVLGSLESSRGIMWVVAATLLVLPADDDHRPHPLGEFALTLTVVALAGIWTGVPDTEPPLGVALALLPVSLLHLARRRAPGPVATLVLVVAMLGAVWTGSAGWGAALATLGAMGLIASGPVFLGFRRLPRGRRLGVLVALQFAVGLALPRFVVFRSVPVAVGVSVVVNVLLVLVAISLVGTRWDRSQRLSSRAGHS